MTGHKSQHFVPQHYLRGFSSDGGSVRLCHLKSGQIVPNASIKNQCCGHYFYGKDRRIEHALASMEGDDETVLKQVRDTLQLPNDSGDRAHLSLIALVLNGRTQKNVGQIAETVSAIKTETARRMVERNLIEAPPDITIDDIRLKDTDNLAPKMAIESAIDHLCLMSDLRMKLLLAPVDHEFVTSDHPTVITNQRFQGRTKFPLSGLVMKEGWELLWSNVCRNCAGQASWTRRSTSPPERRHKGDNGKSQNKTVGTRSDAGCANAVFAKLKSAGPG